MHGMCNNRRRGKKAYQYRKYVCSTFYTVGKSNLTNCGHHAFDQGTLLEVLVGKLREAVLVGGKLDELRDRIKAKLVARKKDRTEVGSMRGRIAELEKQIKRGTERLVLCEDDELPLVREKL